MKIVLLTGWLLCSVAYAGSDPTPLRPEDFAYGITLEADTAAAMHEVSLPDAVYAEVTRTDLGDIRVFNALNEVVPSLVRPPDDQKIRAEDIVLTPPAFAVYVPREVLRAGATPLRIEQRGDRTIVTVGEDGAPLPDEAVGWLMDLEHIDGDIRTLRVDWTQPESTTNRMFTLRLETSTDLHNWSRLGTGVLARLTSPTDQRLINDIAVRSALPRYLRVSWEGNEQPEIRALSLVVQRKQDPLPLPRAQRSLDGQADPQHPGRYLFDIGGVPPVDRIQLQLLRPNSVTSGRLSSSASPTGPWTPHLAGVFYYLQQNGETVANSARDLSAPSTHRYWNFEIDTGAQALGNPEPRLTVHWIPHRVVWLAQGPGPFLLAYGRYNTAPMNAGVQELLRLNLGKSQVQAGTPKALGRPEVREPPPPPANWKPWVLWLVLIAGVGAIGFMAWRLLRDFNADTTPDV